MMNEPFAIRIFVSSPGDVAPERFQSETVIRRLQSLYEHVCRLEPIFWEHEPLSAASSFQEEIPSPAEADIVICILWSRLGSRLPKKFIANRVMTGTEYEFEEAIRSRRERGTPHLLVYRKTTPPIADLSDRIGRREAFEQIEALEAFVEKWFHDDTGSLIAAFHPFDDSATFEEHLEIHLRKLIEDRLRTAEVSFDRSDFVTPSWTNGSPFRGLHSFNTEHAPIFFGRTCAIGDVVDRLKKQAFLERAFMLILGPSGSGKSSLVRAGVIPMLSRPNVIEGVALCRRTIIRPSEGKQDLFGMLAAACVRPEALPELLSDGTTQAELARLLQTEPKSAAGLFRGALSQAAAKVQHDLGNQRAGARLLLVIDQFEELFTSEGITDNDRCRFAELLQALAGHPLSRTWVVATLRSDFYPAFVAVPGLSDLKEGLGQYDLQPPTTAELGQMIRLPAVAAGLTFEENEAGARLDDVLRDEAAKDPSVLPMLEFTLDEMHRRKAGSRKLTFDAYHALGGVTGALASRAEEAFGLMPSRVQKEFVSIFRELVSLGFGTDDRITARQVNMTTFSAIDSRLSFVQILIAARLLVADQAADGQAVVRISHESLIEGWSRLSNWLADDRDLLRIKSRVVASANRWVMEQRAADLLLPPGKPLQEAQSLLAAGFNLDAKVCDFIQFSERRAHQNQRVRQWMIAAIILLVCFGSAISLAFGIEASRQSKRASEKAQLAIEAAAEAKRAKNEASQSRDEAINQRNIAVSAQAELDEANLELASSLARALRGPIGVNERIFDLSAYEVEAMEELASRRGEAVSLRFLEELTRTSATCTQFANRAEFVLQAVIGLDQELSQSFEKLMWEKLSLQGLPEQQTTELALIWNRAQWSSEKLDLLVLELLKQAIDAEPSRSDLQEIAEALANTSHRLSDETSLAVCTHSARRVLAEIHRRERSMLSLSQIIKAISIIIECLEPDVAASIDAELIVLIEGKTSQLSEPFDRSYITATIAPIAERIGDRGNRLFRTAARVLLEELQQTRDSGALSRVAESLSLVASWMEVEEAADICQQGHLAILDVIERAQDTSDKSLLAMALVSMTRHMPPEQAGEVLLEQLTEPGTRPIYGYLAAGLQPIIERMPAAKATEISERAVPRILLAMQGASGQYYLPRLAESLQATATRCDAEQSLRWLSNATSELADSIEALPEAEVRQLGFMAESLGCLLKQLDATTAEELCSRISPRLITALARDVDYFALGEVNDRVNIACCLVTMSSVMDRDAASTCRELAARTLMGAMCSTSLNYDQGRYGKAPLGQIGRDELRKTVMGLQMAIFGGDPFQEQSWPQYLNIPVSTDSSVPNATGQRQTPLLSNQMLMELLQHPYCIGEARRVVVDALASSFDRPFENQWQVVAYTTTN